jgi:hypothetical protein
VSIRRCLVLSLTLSQGPTTNVDLLYDGNYALVGECAEREGFTTVYRGWIKSSGNFSIVLKLLHYLR